MNMVKAFTALVFGILLLISACASIFFLLLCISSMQ
ncbi:Uncharacterised protein [Edwardsiella ictaluri]|nr:Uncharacterised protein [Edwardsiella ictaluri]